MLRAGFQLSGLDSGDLSDVATLWLFFLLCVIIDKPYEGK